MRFSFLFVAFCFSLVAIHLPEVNSDLTVSHYNGLIGHKLVGLQLLGLLGNVLIVKARDAASEQMQKYSDNQSGKPKKQLTTLDGNPIGDNVNSKTVGAQGPLLMEDVQFMKEMAHFDRERIPERVVHAKGAGAHGIFVVTSPEIQKYSKAAVFKELNVPINVLARFSTVAGERGFADSVRDVRGFAVKFYTKDGVWDLVGNNTPIFFVRDPRLFSSFIHTQKRNPQTNLHDKDMFWDFLSLRPESTFQVTRLFSDLGIPDGFRHMNGYGSHTFKLVNGTEHPVYCKFHWHSQQGIKNLSVEDAKRLQAEDPDYFVRDLFNAIEEGNHPQWNFFIQVMTFEQAKAFKFNPFDITKVWSEEEYPLIEVGYMKLNRNHQNYFSEIEQAAFSPANMPPGIEPSPDKMLQGRLFSYDDTAYHRLGVNFRQLPINRGICPIVAPQSRDGAAAYENLGNTPNYWPSSFLNAETDIKYKEHPYKVATDVDRHDFPHDYFEQVYEYYQNMTEGEKQRLADNIGGHLSGAQKRIQEQAASNFDKAHPDYGKRVREALKKYSS